jgi:sugar phosphate isomerase/epimerase
MMDRRQFVSTAGRAAGSLALLGSLPRRGWSGSEPLFKISLAQWSYNKNLFAGKMDNLDFAKTARQVHGIEGVEYVNQFFKDKAKDRAYLGEMKARAEGEDVRSLLIMCDGEGAIGDPDSAKRSTAVENHRKWLEAAKFLGCHSIRVNAQSEGSYDEQMKLAADGLRRLAEMGDEFGLNVLVENHGGLSSNGAWLAGVMQAVDHPRAGTLPDFGNFRVSQTEEYDRYKGVEELMPFAKAVSAKSGSFDADGNETSTDYLRMMKIVLAAGYHGWVGIESGAPEIGGEEEAVRKTHTLLERVRKELAAHDPGSNPRVGVESWLTAPRR